MQDIDRLSLYITHSRKGADSNINDLLHRIIIYERMYWFIIIKSLNALL